jgi:hypothetical protein
MTFHNYLTIGERNDNDGLVEVALCSVRHVGKPNEDIKYVTLLKNNLNISA